VLLPADGLPLHRLVHLNNNNNGVLVVRSRLLPDGINKRHKDGRIKVLVCKYFLYILSYCFLFAATGAGGWAAGQSGTGGAGANTGGWGSGRGY
jgi:hypothetical protein